MQVEYLEEIHSLYFDLPWCGYWTIPFKSRAASSVGVICTVPTVPTQEAIPEEGGKEKKWLKLPCL